MIAPELKKKVIDKVIECKHLADDRLIKDYKVVPRFSEIPIIIKFDLKGSRAGEANAMSFNPPFRPWMRLNEWYLNEYPKDMINTTVPHEMAHIVADIHFGRNCHHGYYWRLIMQKVYDLPPIRTHRFGPSITTRKFQYYLLYCPNCGFRHRFSQKIVNKIEHTGGLARRTCYDCKKNLGSAQIILDNE